MKLSPQFVKALLVLKAHGYERVCSTVGTAQLKTYVQFWTIDELVARSQKDGAALLRAERPPVRRAPQRTLFKSDETQWHGFFTLDEMTSKDVRTGDVLKVVGKLE